MHYLVIKNNPRCGQNNDALRQAIDALDEIIDRV